MMARRLRCGVLAAGTLAAGHCHAAAPVYFDIGPLLAAAGLYLLGLLALPVIFLFSKRKRLWAMVLLAYIVAPIAFVVGADAVFKAENARAAERRRLGERRDVQAFAAYCKGRQRIVHARAPVTRDAALQVRVVPGVGVQNHAFGASTLRDYMVRDGRLCPRSGPAYLEQVANGRYIAGEQRFEQEIRAYAMCSSAPAVVRAQSAARYELVIGESVERQPAPWGGAVGNRMSRVSVRLVDTRDGATLAQDTMYFRSHESGEGGCPEAQAQLASLIADVFPSD